MNKAPRRVAPRHLSPMARRFWHKVMADFLLEEHQVRLLDLACECLDTGEKARQILAEEGLVIEGHLKRKVLNPAYAAERDAKITFARLLRELALEPEPEEAFFRPPRIDGRKS